MEWGFVGGFCIKSKKLKSFAKSLIFKKCRWIFKKQIVLEKIKRGRKKLELLGLKSHPILIFGKMIFLDFDKIKVD